MLSGICLQYCLIAAITVRPNEASCYTRYMGFHVSFTVVYAPLLTRTNRIYRIFTCARRSATLPTLTSPLSQVIIAIILVAIQVSTISSSHSLLLSSDPALLSRYTCEQNLSNRYFVTN
jgi:hypothetical protein